MPATGAMMAGMAVTDITPEEQARRRRAIDHARASSALEGQVSDEATRADQEAYVRGEIDVDELVARANRT